ncbi:MAG: 4Fe-4S dicluster domain-containing protein [Nitrososphaerota archaeon]
MSEVITLRLLEDSSIHTAIKKCIQCGTCSASCPLSHYMDYTPRKIVNMLRNSMYNEVLKSKTIWLCSTCYLCAVRCPAKINLGEFMISLRRHALSNGYNNAQEYLKLIKTYAEFIEKYGRISEAMLMINYSLKTNPVKAIKMIPFALNLMKNGLLSLRVEKVNDFQVVKTKT